MKVTYSVIVLLAAFALTSSLPANKKEEKVQEDPNKDVDFVPLGRDKNFGFPQSGVIDVDAGSFFGDNPFGSNPFSTAFNSFEGALTRMLNLLNQFLGRSPEGPNSPDFPELHIPNFGNVDLGKGNTTSVTKIINGHKVTINDTEYKSDEANGSSFFKVHVVEVHPDTVDSVTTKDVEAAAPPKRDPESIEDTSNNEIPKIKDNEGFRWDDNIETLNEANGASVQKIRSPQWNVESFEDNRIDSAPPKRYDLSNDIYVNELMARDGAKTNPDAEVFESVNGRIPAVQYYPEIRAVPNRESPLNFYPRNAYEHCEQEAMQQMRNLHYYQPPLPMNDPYSNNRFQPQEIVIVPLINDQPQLHSTYVAGKPTPIANSQAVYLSSSNNPTPDKQSGPSTT